MPTDSHGGTQPGILDEQGRRLCVKLLFITALAGHGTNLCAGGGGYHDSGGHLLRARDSTSTTIRGLRGLVRVRVRADHCDRGTTLDAVVCYLPQHLLQT
jgi:hypothetical protein